jgi:hypothetical protein
MAYYEGEISPMGTNCNNGWNDWSWIIGLAVVGGIFGNGGFGFGGNGNRGNCATVQDVASGFSTSEIMSDLNTIINAQTQGFAGLNSAIANSTSTLGYNMLQGFNGIENAICTLGFNSQAGFNALSSQIASCCCDTRSAIADLKYANERNTCQIIDSQNANTRAILDYLTGEKIASLQAENSGLKAQISNDRQSAYIVSQLKEPCPIPAYYVPNPNCCYTPCGASVQ